MKSFKGSVVGLLGALLLCSVSNAQTDTWMQDKSDDGTYMYAAVLNANGNVFGEFCYYSTKTCLWQMSLETRCAENATAPVLLNADTGTAALTVQCNGLGKNGTSYLYRFNWKELESALKGSTTVGIAMALDGNNFRVYRFKLDGIVAAQSKLEHRFFASLPPAPPTAKPATEVL
jgi:hypothetical protein